ncbi:MAG TPA: ABC transporter permease [Terriglobales bacterium]|nr:ABC transporter permease [Terriglobales bacterium]
MSLDMNSVAHDLRYALRQLRKSPGFTAVAVITLALGIGANTAIFSIVEGVLLAPLHYANPERLVMIWGNNPRFPRVFNSYPNFLDWERSSRSFEQMASFREQAVDLTAPGAPSHVRAAQISTGFFSTLGSQLPVGREFTSRENQRGGAPAIVISNHFWRQRFGGEEVLGKTVTLDGVNYSIIGIAPAKFHFEDDIDVYTPLGQLDPLILNNRAAHDGIFTVARLRAGVSVSQSQAEMSSIQDSLNHLYQNDNRDLGVYVEPLKQAIVGNVGQILMLLLGAVCLVLLIACANVSNLLLARSVARNREFAIRTALGASRGRIARQLLTESVMLSLAGVCLGIAIAFFALRFVLPAIPGDLPRSGDVTLNIPVLLYTLGVSLLVGILFGLLPAFKSSNAAPQMSLKESGRGTTQVSRRAQSSFILLQVGSTLVLLVAAGLLFRSILQLSRVNPGFDPQNVITFRVGVSHSLKTPMDIRVAYQQLLDRIRTIPGVQSAELTTAVPLTGEGGYLPFWLDSRKPDSVQGAPRLQPFLTGPDYLRVTEIPLLQGRFLSESDSTNTPCVTVVDKDFAHKFFPGETALGHTITAGFGSAAFGPCTIVGVVGHVKATSLNDETFANQVQAYYSLHQDPDQWVPLNYREASVIIRTPLDVAAIIPAIRRATYQAGSEQPIYDAQTMGQIASASMSEQRFPMMLLGMFAGLSLLLASVGLYGVISYAVTQRTQEIGIRIALGADKRTVVQMFIWQSLRLVLLGIGIGAAGAWIAVRTLSSMSHLLYGVGAADPVTFAAGAVLLMSAAAFASYIPARRAAKVDPMVALRYE